MSSQTYKKLDSGSPSGGLIEKDNLQSILGKGVDLDDLSAVVAAGYVKYDNSPIPDDGELNGRFDKEFVPDTDVELVTGHWSSAWKIADRTMTTAEEAAAKVEPRKAGDRSIRKGNGNGCGRRCGHSRRGKAGSRSFGPNAGDKSNSPGWRHTAQVRAGSYQIG